MNEINRPFIEQLNLPQQVLEQIIEQSLLIDAGQAPGRPGLGRRGRRHGSRACPASSRTAQFVGYDELQAGPAYNRISLAEFESGLRQEIILTRPSSS